MKKLELISTTDKSAVYNQPDLAALTGPELKKMRWAKGLVSKTYVLTGDISREAEVLAALPSDLAVWGLYAAQKADLVVPANVAFTPSIRRVGLKKFEDVKQAYLATRASWQSARPGALTPRQAAETEEVIKNLLPEALNVYFEVSRKPAGMLLLNSYCDYLGEAAELIPWVWVDPALGAHERGILHAAMAAWLQGSITASVHAYVAADNPRAQEFFKAMGFALEAVYVMKEK